MHGADPRRTHSQNYVRPVSHQENHLCMLMQTYKACH